MENYNSLLLQQLVPLLFFQIEETSDVIAHLVKAFDQFNIKDSIWDNSIIKNRLLNIKYRIKVIESLEYQLIEGIIDNAEENEHSLLSPFNAKSDLFPNGILSDKWFKKYIEDIPFACIVTFKLMDISDGDIKLAERINNLKNAYQEFRINLVVIIISDSIDISADDDRVNKLRQMTGLPRLTGLIYLNSSPETVHRDSNILVTSILSNLKNIAVDFYLNIEHKVKQRHKKYYSCPSTSQIDTTIELTPIFLETRNFIKQGMISQLAHPHNLESSLKHLEYAYQNIIELSKDNFSKLLREDSVLSHDRNIYVQFRTLIDIIAFHIVRGYLSLEEPISALKKHKAHIINVLDAFSLNDGDSNNWISIQYRWLGELMTLIPSSILNSLNIKNYKKKSKNSKVFKIHGGIQFHESHDYDLITCPEFVFMKSAEYLTKVSYSGNSLKYLNNLNGIDEISGERIRLLLSAKKCLQNEDSSISSSHEGHGNLNSMKQYLDWLIANEHSKLSDEASLSKVIEFYELCLSESQLRNNTISQFVLQELLKYYSKSKNTSKSLYTVIKLASLPSITNNVPLHIDLNGLDLSSSPISLDGLYKKDTRLIDIDVLLLSKDYNKVGPNESALYEPCVCQLVFKPLVHLQTFKSLLSNLEDDTLVKLLIKKSTIKFSKQGEKTIFGAFNDVVLSHNSAISEKSNNLQTIKFNESEDTLGGSINICFTDSEDKENMSRVLQFSQVAQKAGTYLVAEINLEIEIRISSKEKVLNLNKTESIIFDSENSANLAHHKWMYETNFDKEPKLQKKAVRLYSLVPHVIRVLPLKPDVIVTMEHSTISSIIVGERISIPFLIQYKRPKNQKVDYKKVLLVPKVKIVSDIQEQGFISPLTTQVNWDYLKDDEPLSLKSLVSNEEESNIHILNINILNSSLNANDSTGALNKTYRALIDLKTLVSGKGEDSESVDEEHDLAIYDTADYTLPVINNPFDCQFSIGPRYRNENTIDMPCPFVLSPDNENSGGSSDKINNYSMPIATRLWLGKLSLVDNLAQSEDSEDSSELEIVETNFSIKAKNLELLVEMEGATESANKSTVTQVFSTKSKSGFSHRNVVVNVTVNIKWKRKDNKTLNEFKSIEWQIVLPLSDPRVLLALAFEKLNMAKFKYIIENPTPRIFMFTTQLSTEEINDDIEWQFDDDRNIVALRQPAFPVLPFHRNIIEFYAKLTNNTTRNLIALPQFKVYDIHYKVTLPTLAVCENVVVKNTNSLYWQISDPSPIEINH